MRGSKWLEIEINELPVGPQFCLINSKDTSLAANFCHPLPSLLGA